VQRRYVFWALNLALGLTGLIWVLRQFGRGAVSLLSGHPSPMLLTAFAVAVLVAIVAFSARWRILLDALGVAPSFARLCAFRAASQSLSAILPGGRLGGEPLRAWYAVQSGVPVPAAITTVVVDRTLEMATGLAFVVTFALVLAERDVPGIGRTVVGAVVGTVSLAIAIVVSLRRLRAGGLLAPFVRTLGATRPAIAQHAGTVDLAEDAARRLLDRPARLASALAMGFVADLLTLVQYACLLAAFGLPSTPLSVVAAVFASGAARTLPVPGAVGTVEAADVWIFGMLGHPPEVGLAVALATRLRDVVWAAPGFLFLLVRALRPPLTPDAGPSAHGPEPVPDVDRSPAGT
jgi:uncharacterized membrane protein YbhN (UPF0104 family)